MSIFLTRLRLDLKNSEVRRDLRNRHDLHRTIMSGFPDGDTKTPRADHAVLFRLEPEGLPTVLVQSRSAPSYEHLARRGLLSASPESKGIDEALSSLSPGRQVGFRLLANPTRKIDTKSAPDGTRRHGRRVPLREESARLAWLDRKLNGAELAPDLVRVQSVPIERGRSRGRTITIEGVLYEGLLSITEPRALKELVSEGVGPSRAYGFGLLSLRPPG